MSRSRSGGHPSGLIIRRNPTFAGQKPRKLVPTCHDGTPFLTIEHECGEEFHLHESQIAEVPAGAELASRCRTCRKTFVYPVDTVREAFHQMRKEGWYE